VKLVDAGDGAQIWGDRFDDVLEDVFALQDNVALSVAGVIEPAITEAEARRVSRRAPENMSSYDLYLMGYAAFQTFRKDEIERALGLFERAIEFDPTYASALAMAAQCHSMTVVFGWTGEPEKHRRLGLALAERALVLAGSDDWLLALIGNALMTFDASRDRSAGLIDRAIALNPGSAAQRAIKRLEKAVAREPDNGSLLAYGVAALAVLGDVDRAHDWARHALLIDPDDSSLRFNLACAMVRLKDVDYALELLGAAFDLSQGGLVTTARNDSDFDPLREDPRFDEIMARGEALLAAKSATNAGG
jgi:tetratricopeptide (TPR) repeat protein